MEWRDHRTNLPLSKTKSQPRTGTLDLRGYIEADEFNLKRNVPSEQPHWKPARATSAASRMLDSATPTLSTATCLSWRSPRYPCRGCLGHEGTIRHCLRVLDKEALTEAARFREAGRLDALPWHPPRAFGATRVHRLVDLGFPRVTRICHAQQIRSRLGRDIDGMCREEAIPLAEICQMAALFRLEAACLHIMGYRSVRRCGHRVGNVFLEDRHANAGGGYQIPGVAHRVPKPVGAAATKTVIGFTQEVRGYPHR